MLNKLKMLLASVLLACCVIPNAAQALRYDQITQVYFFGDSLTDSGWNNTFPDDLGAGKAPTFTTNGGYIWSQYVARDIKGFVLPVYHLGSPDPSPPDTITNNAIYAFPPYSTGTLTGVDYAAGGSTTNGPGNGFPWAPSLVQQVTYYLNTAPAKLDPRNVYFIWSGANDLLILTNSGIPTELQLLTAAKNAAINIGKEIAALSARGARRFVVLSLPNIGYTPYIGELASTYPTLPAMMKNISFAFNSMLNTQLGVVIAQYGIKILYLDVFTLLDAVINATKAGQPYVVAGQSFKFINYNMPACTYTAIVCDIYPNVPPSGYIFADTLHPTNQAHRLLSLYVEQAILNWKV